MIKTPMAIQMEHKIILKTKQKYTYMYGCDHCACKRLRFGSRGEGQERREIPTQVEGRLAVEKGHKQAPRLPQPLEGAAAAFLQRGNAAAQRHVERDCDR